MKALIDRTKSFVLNEDGPTATEYAVMLALIIIASLVAITSLGTKVSGVFTNVKDAMPVGST